MTAEVVKTIQWSKNSKLRYFDKEIIDTPKDIKTKDTSRHRFCWYYFRALNTNLLGDVIHEDFLIFL